MQSAAQSRISIIFFTRMGENHAIRGLISSKIKGNRHIINIQPNKWPIKVQHNNITKEKFDMLRTSFRLTRLSNLLVD